MVGRYPRPGGCGLHNWLAGEGLPLSWMARAVRTLGEAYSPAGSRAPRSVMSVTAAVNTSPAQVAAPRSCGGRAGQSHGVVIVGGCYWVYKAYAPGIR